MLPATSSCAFLPSEVQRKASGRSHSCRMHPRSGLDSGCVLLSEFRFCCSQPPNHWSGKSPRSMHRDDDAVRFMFVCVTHRCSAFDEQGLQGMRRRDRKDTHSRRVRRTVQLRHGPCIPSCGARSLLTSTIREAAKPLVCSPSRESRMHAAVPTSDRRRHEMLCDGLCLDRHADSRS